MPTRFQRAAFAILTAGFLAWFSRADFPAPYNTEKSASSALAPAAAAASFRLPEGFKATVFAAEPDVQQPIAMAFDPRGRLWVAENYTYAEARVSFATNLADRILILEDQDNDGHFDKRTVFWDEGRILTSVEVGLGGVFVLCPPRLLFIPDRNGDDIPDGPPEVLLDGFATTTGNHHTFANGLKWGPDGWLWGRIGISSGAKIGVPGAPESERFEMRGGIWRYNPRRHVAEAVCHGTTNPWGLDWNEVGEPFFINTVIGHLWHAIPGAHLQRMHGDDVNPYSYELIGQHADHYHFDTGAGWTKSRAAFDGSSFAAGSDNLGGGHAHCGLMIYQGDNWPEKYRGRLFTLNLHGRRVNMERLERQGSGYVGRHDQDLFSVGDPWFRGMDLIQGPDGAVFVSDWSDTGECHDSDGVHRTSGRIYKISYGSPKPPLVRDLTKLSNSDLLPQLFNRNEWSARMARRVLADRELLGRANSETRRSLLELFATLQGSADPLRALWALNSLEPLPADWLAAQLERGGDEYRLSWLVRLLAESPDVAAGKWAAAFEKLAHAPGQRLVHLYLASALQRLPVPARLGLATALVSHADEAADHNLPLLLWQGIEPLVASDASAAVSLARASRPGLLRQFIARRLAEDLETRPAALDRLLSAAWDPVAGSEILTGISTGLRGWRKAIAPTNWPGFAKSLESTADNAVRERLRDLGLLFGDGRALDDLRALLADPKADTATRRNAMKTLVDARAENVAPLLRRAADDGGLRVAALVGLLQLGDPEAAKMTLARYQWVGLEERSSLLAAMVTRPSSARVLVEAVAAGNLPRADLTPAHARQIASLQDAGLNQRLEAVWGSVRPNDAEKRRSMDSLRKQLAAESLQAANLVHGRLIFQQVCAPCHQLYGSGGIVGPDLTGGGRASLDYLLENIVDPGAVVPAESRMTVVTLKDGRVLNGILREPTARTIVLLSATERVTLDRGDVAGIESLNQSMMPDGLLEGLPGTDARDLIAYLMHPRQVPLPGGAKP